MLLMPLHHSPYTPNLQRNIVDEALDGWPSLAFDYNQRISIDHPLHSGLSTQTAVTVSASLQYQCFTRAPASTPQLATCSRAVFSVRGTPLVPVLLGMIWKQVCKYAIA